MTTGTAIKTRDDGRFGLVRFVTELRRRKVCRALTTYCVALWLVCQIVEIVTPAFGLPEWTVTLVIVLGISGVPIALILSWLFDVTPDGLVRDTGRAPTAPHASHDLPRSRFDQAIDCGLLVVALIIGAQMALSAMSSNVEASTPTPERVAIMPFAVNPAVDAESFSAALLIELQHELSRQATVTVVAPTNPANRSKVSRLTGSVMVLGSRVRVTAIMIDDESGEVTWSEIFEFAYDASDLTPMHVARDIAAELTTSPQPSSEPETRHARN